MDVDVYSTLACIHSDQCFPVLDEIRSRNGTKKYYLLPKWHLGVQRGTLGRMIQ